MRHAKETYEVQVHTNFDRSNLQAEGIKEAV